MYFGTGMKNSTSNIPAADKKPIVFFAHHQGRGHANRVMAIADHLADRRVIVFTAAPAQFDDAADNVEVAAIPDMIGARPQNKKMYEQPTPAIMHCVPVGVPQVRQTMARILAVLDLTDPALFVIDVSAEIALLSRIASIPAVKIRMHGDRDDKGHEAAYESCIGMIAPFSSVMEQDNYPLWARNKTFYTGGLCTSKGKILSSAAAREKLGLPAEQKIVLTVAGGGGSGTPYAPLTMAARAEPDTLWLIAGECTREGHETDFANLHELGWTDQLIDYLCAADVVIGSAGDNLVHEIFRVGRPFICIPEWRYFDEQQRKAAELGDLGAAIYLDKWPASLSDWVSAMNKAERLDTGVQKGLHDPDAAKNAADYIETLAAELEVSDLKASHLH